jgi:hypothetical protein
VHYLEFLQQVHELLEPPTYLEVGVRHGSSLALARSPSVGVDPAYDLRKEIPQDAVLFRETSDEYFDRSDVLAPFEGRPVGLAFIDGMHLVEYALRDFINVERHTDWTSVVVFDDIFPADVDMAARKRHTVQWTGDVYKIAEILARHRRDLICLPVGTSPSGLLLVLGLDPESRVLDRRYDEIVLEAVRPDPQRVSTEVFERRGAIEPDAVLGASFWSVLRDAREDQLSRRRGLRALRRRIRDEVRPGVTPALVGAPGR